MSKVQKIFAGIDFSTGSDEALRQAHERAASPGARLAVCHVVPNELQSNVLFPHISRVATLNIPTDLARAGEAVAARVQEITGRTPADYDMLIDEGTPYATLLSQAEEWMADLIVVGSKGMTSANVLLGSVTSQIIRHAHCPVLIVRPGRGGGGIVAGTDFSDPAMPALRAAADEALRTGRELTLAHSLDLIWSAVSYPVMAFGGAPIRLSADQMRELEDAAEQKLADALRHLNVKGGIRVVQGAAGPALMDLAAQMKADLLVVGTIGRTGLRRALLGSVAESVAAGAPCSVLIVRLQAS